MTVLIIVLLIIVLLVVGVGAWILSSYNGLIKLRNQVQEAWHQIDVELKRRHDLIPNLLETVKGYATHERETLDEVLRARSAAVNGNQNPAAAAQSEGQLTQALGHLMAVAEAYPDLKANQNFVALQQELSSTEDRIAAGRRYYNAVVRELNTKVESIPSKFVAGMAGASRAEYFETDGAERNVPQVSFGAGGAAGGPAGAQAPGYSPVEPKSIERGTSAPPASDYLQQGDQQAQPRGYPQSYPQDPQQR